MGAVGWGILVEQIDPGGVEAHRAFDDRRQQRHDSDEGQQNAAEHG